MWRLFAYAIAFLLLKNLVSFAECVTKLGFCIKEFKIYINNNVAILLNDKSIKLNYKYLKNPIYVVFNCTPHT